MENLKSIERHLFPVINKVLNKFKTTGYIFVSGDSTAVRAYTGYARDIEDLDLIFHPATDVTELQNFIITSFPDSKQETLVTIQNEDKTGGFLRCRFPIEIVYQMEKYFIVDFHVGGSVYKGEFAYKADDIFFQNIKWEKIKSASGLEETNMPVTTFEEVLLFKLVKFLGKDQIDLLSLLISRTIETGLLVNRINSFEKELLKQNLNSFENKLSDLIKQWEAYHTGFHEFFFKFPNSNKTLLKKNISTLRNLF